MKILILTDGFPPDHSGGAEVVAYNLAQYFVKKGEKVSVITTVRKKREENIYKDNNITIYKIYSDYNEKWRAYISLYNPQTIGKIEDIIVKTKPDIIHAHNIHYYLSYRVLKIAKKNRAKVFLTAHDVMLFHYGKLIEFINPNNVEIPKKFNYKISAWQQIKKYKRRYNPFRNIIIKHYLKYVDKIFAVSFALKEALNQNGINNIEVIYNGIDVTNWRQITEKEVGKFKNKFNLENKKIILFGGRLSAAKGGEKIIYIIKEIVQKIPDAVLLVLGRENNYTKKMRELAKSLTVEDKIIFTGWIMGEELKSAYKLSSIIVVPSLYLDPFPTVNLEAMAYGKPIVGTCFGGTPEIVKNGKCGFIVNPYNIQQFSNKIIELLLDEDKRSKFGDNCFKRVRKEFTLEKQGDNYLNFFK